MKFHIPFTISSIERLKRNPILFHFLIRYKKKSKLEEHLENSDTGITREQYLNISFKSFSASFIMLYIISTTVLFFLKINLFYLLSFVFIG